MTSSSYNLIYTNRDQPRATTRPRSGSFVEFFTEVPKDSESKISSNVYIFKALEGTTEKNGSYGCVRKFKLHPTEEEGRESLNTNPIGKIKAIAVKKYRVYQREKFIRYSTNIHRKIRGFGEFIHAPNAQFQFYEYIEGNTLEEHKFKNETEVLEALASLVEDLANLHAAGYVHCDLHPRNIIVTEEKCSEEKKSKTSVKIIDFDLVEKLSLFDCAINWDFQCLTDVFQLILTNPKRFHLSSSSRDFIRQIYALFGEKRRPSLKIIKKDIDNHLLLLEAGINEFQYSKNLLVSFLEHQIYFLNEEEKNNSKGAREKKARFKSIRDKLDKITQSKDLEVLIMETAIVAHHRRKRSRDQLGYIFTGFFTLGLGFCCDLWGTEAYSWQCWQRLKFSANSSYAVAYNSSLESATRTVTVSSAVCNNYEDLRTHAPFARL